MPNALTFSRLALATVFFVMLASYQYEGRGDPLLLNLAFVIYLIAVVTDILDGYLARRWQVEGALGRVVDPFVDKVLVLGSFIFFAGKNFTIPSYDPTQIPTNVHTITGVAPWMVVLLLGRELLVTSLRGESESGGQSFGAVWSGKLKMVFQSVTIGVILIYVNYRGWLLEHRYEGAARLFRDFCIWATLAMTVLSGGLYIQRALQLHRRKPPAPG